MSAKHTPVPWSTNGNLIEGPDGETIAYVTAYNTLTPKQKANARLIAAAPDLLEALERIAGFTLSQFMGPHDMALECVTVARAAIAKAEGRA